MRIKYSNALSRTVSERAQRRMYCPVEACPFWARVEAADTEVAAAELRAIVGKHFVKAHTKEIDAITNRRGR